MERSIYIGGLKHDPVGPRLPEGGDMTEKLTVRCAKCHVRLGVVHRCEQCGLPFCSMHVNPSSHGCAKKQKPVQAKSHPGRIRISRRLAVSLIVIIVASVGIPAFLRGSGQEEEEIAPAIRWVKTEKLRAGYCDPGNSSDILQRLVESGVNTVITYSSLERVKEVAPLYRDKGLHLFVSIPFLVAGTDYRHSVKKDGEEKVAPCPLDSQYWSNMVLSRLVSVAEASKTHPIDGVLMDTEMGSSPTAHYYSRTLCFCDDCFQRYARATGKGSETLLAIPWSERYEWLESKGYLEEYYSVLEKRVEDMVREFERKVHEINPDLLLGFLLYEDNWYYRALARGLSTPSMPVIVLDETTYIRGYTYLVDEILDYFQSRRMNVLYLPGLWLLHHTPENITSQIFYLASNTSGYWIFPLGSLWTENLTGDCRLAGPSEGYWNSLVMANSELDRYLQGEYRSSLVQPVQEISPFQFQVFGDQGTIAIQNLGFADRRNIRVAVNGEMLSKISVIRCKGSSDPISFEKKYLNTSSGFSTIGLHQVAVMDSSGRIYNLLGETDPSVFSKK